MSVQERESFERICHMNGRLQIVQQFLVPFSFGFIRERIQFFLGYSNGKATLTSEFVIASLFIFRWNENSNGPLMKNTQQKFPSIGTAAIIMPLTIRL